MRGRVSTAMATAGRSSDRVSERVGAQVVLEAEALDAAQQDAGGDLVPPVQVQQMRRRRTACPMRCRSPK